jgi:CRISPR-associated exonuclease Cas4
MEGSELTAVDGALEAAIDGETLGDMSEETTGRLGVPISALEHYSYCPRQCALIHVEQTFDENQFTIRGRIAHERVDSAEARSTRGVRSLRGIPLWSDRYGLIGRADVVELRTDGPFPLEYKLGRRRSEHADLQLCAQALCLEEMLGVAVPAGAVYYREERRRHPVRLDAGLRARTIDAIEAVRQQLETQELPPAPNDARCPNCSLVNACLPSIVGEAQRMRRHAGELFRPLPAPATGDGDAEAGQ